MAGYTVSSKKHQVLYDDDEMEEVDLRSGREAFRILDGDPNNSKP